jgi:hypothetical protein
MPFNISFGKSAGDQLTQKYTPWVITAEGRRMLENYSGPPTPKFKVLSTLATVGGTANVEEVAQYAKMGKDVVEFQLNQLAQAGCCRKRKASGEEQTFES